MRPRVALSRCRDYDQARVEAAVHESLEMLGGIEKFVIPGEKVFLKINLLLPKKIEQAVTTHPAVVKAMVRQVQAAGGIVTIGDCPGGPYSARTLKRAYRAGGVDRVAEETGAYLNFDVEEVVLPHANGKLLKHITVAQATANADAVITVPKLKTHGLTALTGAVKILFGVIPGLKKAEYHLKMPDVQDFSDMLLDILTLIKPRLTVMDGIVGMEGAGPSAGDPRTVGVILASADSVACDIVAASVIGIKPDRVTTTSAAIARGMTSGQLSEIELAGHLLEEVRVNDFKPSKAGFAGSRQHKPLYRFIEWLLRPKPAVMSKLCSGCGTCVDICPPQAITLAGKIPQTDYDKCIRCFCCQELCPQAAVVIRRPWIAACLFRL